VFINLLVVEHGQLDDDRVKHNNGGHMNTSESKPNVEPVETPNTDAMMFRVQETLVPTGTFEYTRAANTDTSPLATIVLEEDGTELVLIAPRFITVRKSADHDWANLAIGIIERIQAFLASGEMAVTDQRALACTHNVDDSDVAKQVIALLDEEVRPAIAQDGGDVSFERFEEGIVYLRLSGACGSCPSASMTLKFGIERLIMEEIPEVRGVEDVGEAMGQPAL